MTRPQIVKALNQKFVDDGFKSEGMVTISNKKVAKTLEVTKDYQFHAKDYHKFIARFYNSTKSSNTANA